MANHDGNHNRILTKEAATKTVVTFFENAEFVASEFNLTLANGEPLADAIHALIEQVECGRTILVPQSTRSVM